MSRSFRRCRYAFETKWRAQHQVVPARPQVHGCQDKCDRSAAGAHSFLKLALHHRIAHVLMLYDSRPLLLERGNATMCNFRTAADMHAKFMRTFDLQGRTRGSAPQASAPPPRKKVHAHGCRAKVVHCLHISMGCTVVFKLSLQARIDAPAERATPATKAAQPSGSKAAPAVQRVQSIDYGGYTYKVSDGGSRKDNCQYFEASSSPHRISHDQSRCNSVGQTRAIGDCDVARQVGDCAYVVTDVEAFNAAGGLDESCELEACEVSRRLCWHRQLDGIVLHAWSVLPAACRCGYLSL